MAITFTKACEDIEPGDPILSEDMVKLANAYNDRIHSGVGDFTYRLAWSISSIFRNIVVDAPDNYIFDFFHFDPRFNSTQDFPSGSAGDPGGLNLSNPLALWAVGSSVIERVEPTVTTFPPNTFGFTPVYTGLKNENGRWAAMDTSASDLWERAAKQRGAILSSDLNSPVSPFRSFAESYVIADFAQSGNGFNETWGGYQPTPPLDESDGAGGNCNSDSSSPYFKFRIRFLKLTSGAPTGDLAGFWIDPHVDFGNTCPEQDPPITADQVTSDYGTSDASVTPYVLGFTETANAYKVILWNGTNEISHTLPKSDYQFVVDGDGSLQHKKLEQSARTYNWIINRLRGADAQRTREFDIESIAFDVDRYFTTQNRLAPAFGADAGGGNLTATYRRFQFTSNVAGTKANNLTDGGTSYTHHASFCPAGIEVVGTGITGVVQLKMIVDSEDFYTVRLDATNTSVIKYFDKPTAGSTIEFEMIGGDSFTNIEIQVADLLEEKGSFDQLAALLRSGTSGNSYAVDGQPELTDIVKIVSDNYFNSGIAIAPGGGPRSHTDHVQESALFDGARKMAKSFFSACDSQEFSSIASDGSSTTLEFNRYVDDSTSLKKDIFSDILPVQSVDSGEIKPGIKYILLNVSGGATSPATVTYNGVTYNNDDEFTGVVGTETYDVSSSDYQVFQAEGIYSDAPEAGWSNEWVMMIQTMLMDTIGSNPSFQLNDYALNYPLVNRCCVNSSGANSKQKYMARDLLPSLYKPEIPQGYTYDPTLQSSPSEDFYRSCRVYPKPYVIESVTHKQSAAGVFPDRVIVKITGTLQKHPSADSTYTSDPATWNIANLEAEDFRTDENALRQFISENNALNTGTPFLTGDASANTSNPANSGGARIPQFFFTKLIPKPHEDDNDVCDLSTDTIFTADIWPHLEYFLRVMCEGYIDPDSSTDHACSNTSISFDYTYPNLMIQATGRPWLSPVPIAQNPDAPRGFGNYPRQKAWAEVFSNIGKAVNLLTNARLILPFELEKKDDNYEDIIEIPSPDINTASCSTASADVLQNGFSITKATTLSSAGSWVGSGIGALGGTLVYASHGSIIGNSPDCPVSGNHGIRNTRVTGELRGAITGVNPTYALHQDLLDHISDGGVSILALRTIKTFSDSLTLVGSSGPNTVNLGGSHYQVDTTETVESEECILVSTAAQLFDPGDPPSGDFYRDGDDPLSIETNSMRREIKLTFSEAPTPFLHFELV